MYIYIYIYIYNLKYNKAMNNDIFIMSIIIIKLRL